MLLPSSASRRSVSSTQSLASTTPSHPSPSPHPIRWIPYATLRAEGLVYHNLKDRRQQSHLAQLLQEVRALPSSPRRPFLKTKERQRLASPKLPTLESVQGGEEEEKEQVATAGQTEEEKEQRKEVHEGQESVDVLAAHAAASSSSARLARLAEKRSRRHHAELDAFAAWEEHHKHCRTLRVTELCQAFLASTSAHFASPPPPSPPLPLPALLASHTSAVDELIASLLTNESDSLSAVQSQLTDVACALLDIGHCLPAAIGDLLTPMAERWTVWGLRNRQSVRELEWRLKEDGWEQMDRERQRREKEAAVVTAAV